MTVPLGDSKKTPLIMSVDDDPTIRKLVEHYITTNTDWNVVFASNGMEALEMLETSRPNLILIDVMMPGMDGYEVCARLQKNKETAYVPVVFATALGEERDMARAFAVGAVDYLVKPFQKEALIEKVGRYLKIKNDWSDIAQAASCKGGVANVKDFDLFREFLRNKESMGTAESKQLSAAPADDLYAACGKLGIKNSIVAKHIAEFMRVPYMDHVNPNDLLLGVLPTRFCRANHVVVLADVGYDMAFVLSNPFDWQLNDVFSLFLGQGQTYRMIITEPQNIERLFDVADAITVDQDGKDPGPRNHRQGHR